MSVPSIGLIAALLIVGTVETKFRLVRLPCPLFTALVLLIFTKLLGGRCSDLTFGSVGELCTHSHS